ncbi:hypothetical protein IQ06DRAFT_303144 [Phaeosphaeriaceae sp. SRC1lsM3a]|nr:hypothetical protein IQ06DRAFT_303144 [Stagonospora sp. SRC1lsM3a]
MRRICTHPLIISPVQSSRKLTPVILANPSLAATQHQPGKTYDVVSQLLRLYIPMYANDEKQTNSPQPKNCSARMLPEEVKYHKINEKRKENPPITIPFAAPQSDPSPAHSRAPPHQQARHQIPVPRVTPATISLLLAHQSAMYARQKQAHRLGSCSTSDQ